MNARRRFVRTRVAPGRVFLTCLLAMLTLAACTDGGKAQPKLYHDGLLFIATGNTTGVYYQLGGGLADLATKYMPGYQVRAEPTGASGENMERIDIGDMDIALTQADTAADAALGRDVFLNRPKRICALARLYVNYAQVVVRADAKIRTMADMKGKRFSSGSPNSGTEMIGLRLLRAAGLDPDQDITRLKLSLADTTKGMADGSIDAMIFVSGLPNPGIKEMVEKAPGDFEFLDVSDLVGAMADKYGPVYQKGTIAKSYYKTKADVNTVTVLNLLVVSPDMPDQLAYNLTKILFEHQGELSVVHREAANYNRATGRLTDPVLLHPGARRFYSGG